MRQLLINSDLLDSRILSSVYGTLELFMTGNLNLKEDSPPLIFLNPGGANRFVNMPPLERGMSYRISHIGVANTLTIRDFNNNTIVSLAASEVVDLTASATAWTFIAGSNETGTGGGGGLSNAYVALTDGSNSAVSVGGDTIKFRTGALLTGVVTNDDVTHGDNVLFNHASYPALSVLANPTNVGAIPTTLASSVNGDVLWRSGSALIFGPLAFGTVGLTGQLPIANGGTAAGNSQAAINNLGQLTTIGDILFHNGTNHTRFPRGSDGQVLTAQTATGLAWANANAHSHTSGDISDFAEAVDDRVGAGLFQNSTSILFTYTDVSNTMSASRAALTGDATAALNGNATTVVSASTSFAFSGIISDLGLAVSQNNYNPTGLAGATTIRISSTGPIDITGLQGGAAGRLMVLQNVGTQAITLKNLSGSSTATNQFALNNDIGLSTNQTVALLYDATTQKWRATGAPSPAGSLTDGNKGDITVGSSGADFQINAGAVGFPEMVDILTDSLIGRDTIGTGDPENITLNATLSMTGAGQLQRAALTGDVTANAGNNTTSIANGVVTFAKMQNITTDRLLGRDTATSGVVEEISVGGGVEFTGTQAIQTSAFTGDVVKTAGSVATVVQSASQAFALTGDLTPPTITANQDNYNPTNLNISSSLRLATDASRDITGLSGGADGRFMLIHNIGSFPIVLKDESGSSTAANRFAMSGDLNIATDQSCSLIYDSASSRWRLLAVPPSGGGITDGDKGDVAVTGGGTVWTVQSAAGEFALMGDIADTIASTPQNNYNPAGLATASTLRLTATLTTNITGLQGGTDGRFIIIHNVGSSAITLKDEDAGSTATNRFALNADIVLNTDNSCSLQYDNTATRWRAVSSPTAVTGALTDGNKGDITVSGSGTIWTITAIGGVPLATITPIGRQTIWVPAGSMTSRATAGSENTTRTVNGITVPVQKFDQTTQEGVNFDVAFPKSWNNGTVFFQPYWTAASGAGTAIFQLRGGCFADNVSINTTGFGTAVSSTDTFQNADRVHVSPESAAVTLSNAAVDRLAFFELVRDVATDTLTADAELIGIKLIYVTAAGSDT